MWHHLIFSNQFIIAKDSFWKSFHRTGLFEMKTLIKYIIIKVQLSSVQSFSRVWLFATPWIAACQASLSITNSQSSPRLMSIKSVMPSSHLILCCPLRLLSPIPPSIRVFSNESTLHMRWPKYYKRKHINQITSYYIPTDAKHSTQRDN